MFISVLCSFPYCMPRHIHLHRFASPANTEQESSSNVEQQVVDCVDPLGSNSNVEQQVVNCVDPLGSNSNVDQQEDNMKHPAQDEEVCVKVDQPGHEALTSGEVDHPSTENAGTDGSTAAPDVSVDTSHAGPVNNGGQTDHQSNDGPSNELNTRKKRTRKNKFKQ